MRQAAGWTIESALAIPGQALPKISPQVRAWLTSRKLADLMEDKNDGAALTPVQMRKIATNARSAETFHWLEHERIKGLMNQGFTLAQIVSIAVTTGARGALEWLEQPDNPRELMRGTDGGEVFTTAQIAAIAANNGGKGTLEWLAQADNRRQLMRDTDGGEFFTTKQIAAIAANHGGKGVLEWLAQADNRHALMRDTDGRQRFNRLQIFAIANKFGAKGVLEWLAQAGNLPRLMHDADGNRIFTSEQIAAIAGNNGARGVLEWLAQAGNLSRLMHDAVGRTFLDTAQIAVIAGNNGGKGVLEWLAQADNLRKLTQAPLGQQPLTTPQIFAIARHKGASSVLEWLAQTGNLHKLMYDGVGRTLFDTKQIASIADNNGAHGVLEWLAQADNLGKLMRDPKGLERFKPEQIASMASKEGARGVLEWLAQPDKLDKLMHDRDRGLFTTLQITAIASREGARGVLDWLAQHENLHRLMHEADGTPLFTAPQIAGMASHRQAVKTLEDVAALGWKGVLTKDEVVFLVGADSGFKALAWMMTYQHLLPAKDAAGRRKYFSAAHTSTKGARERILAGSSGEGQTAASRSTGSKHRHPPDAIDAARPKRSRKGKEVSKREPSPIFKATQPAPMEGTEIDPVNTAQSLYVPTLTHQLFDLTIDDGEHIGVLTLRRPEEAMLVSGSQTADPRLDKMFPIRDPAHPNQVHPAYADPSNSSRCAPAVRCLSATFTRTNQDKLWNAMRSNFGRPQFRDKKLFIEAVTRSCKDEMAATLRNELPPSCGQVEVVRIERQHCATEEEANALEGQYGAILKSYQDRDQPSLRNGRIMGLFAGCRLGSEEADKAYTDVFGEMTRRVLEDYAANTGTRRPITWAPYGGGNAMQYLNTSFHRNSEGVNVVDAARTHAQLMPLTFTLTDKDGKERKETLLAVVQVRPVPEGTQILLNYGSGYTLAPPPDPMEIDPRPVKLEQTD